MRFLAFLAGAASVAALDSASFRLTSTLQEPIAPRFIGFSIEVGAAPEVFLVGGLGGSPRPSFAALMNGLRVAMGDAAGPSVRVGGNSADESAWVPTGPLPTNTTYRIQEADLDAYVAATALFNGTIILDTTLRYPTPEFAVAHVAAAVKRLPNLEAVEVRAGASIVQLR